MAPKADVNKLATKVKASINGEPSAAEKIEEAIRLTEEAVKDLSHAEVQEALKMLEEIREEAVKEGKNLWSKAKRRVQDTAHHTTDAIKENATQHPVAYGSAALGVGGDLSVYGGMNIIRQRYSLC